MNFLDYSCGRWAEGKVIEERDSFLNWGVDDKVLICVKRIWRGNVVEK